MEMLFSISVKNDISFESLVWMLESLTTGIKIIFHLQISFWF
jgi:hypothetical protein